MINKIFSDLEEDSDSENEPSTSKVKGDKHIKANKEKSNASKAENDDEEEENVAIKNSANQDEFNFDNYDEECKLSFLIPLSHC